MYQGDEANMVYHLETKYINSFEKNMNPRYTAKGRFDLMRDRMIKNI